MPAEIEKRRIETIAEAEAEKIRRIKKGEADGLYATMDAEAKGLRAILTQKAEGFAEIVKSCGGTPEQAAMMLVTEQLPKLIEEQVKAISNLKIDSITVWDSGAQGDGKTKTADFLSGLIRSLPPLHDLTKNAGLELPEYLGRLAGNPHDAADILKAAPQKAAGKTPAQCDAQRPPSKTVEDETFKKAKDLVRSNLYRIASQEAQSKCGRG